MQTEYGFISLQCESQMRLSHLFGRPTLDHIPEIPYSFSRHFSSKIKTKIEIINFKYSKVQFNINPHTNLRSTSKFSFPCRSGWA